jgi:hypothetical protein|uniref:Uncharacterized protein n=1 Tax=Siphoviridae sp. ctRNB7 TaxID=2825502 RepID=A0A8S5PV62_9CAUD|nr:MAG TPA: hypothetical protein [Siphoviridae sp. ctRNB7]
MKDFLKKNILPLLSLLISVITLLLFWCRFTPFTWDSFGAMATLLGVIVTFLVGFQIWMILNNGSFESNIKEIQKGLDIKMKIIEKSIKDADYTYNLYFAKIYGESLNLPEYIRFSLQTIYYGVQCETPHHISGCNDLIRNVNSIITNCGELMMTSDKQEILLQNFYKVENILQSKDIDKYAFKNIGKSIKEAIIVED